MLNQKLTRVFRYAFAVLMASLVLALLDLTQAPTPGWSYILTDAFWSKLLFLFLIYLFGSYVLVFYVARIKARIYKN
ncbi:hypothetical protein HUW51_07315 [Adhaeribacter swui]|uniref:Uncharacterized protein n=1 Tax=Adhaeribacter swui TaxID=2086471 RepID=A0A7G7G5V9_9BACT|nr:hypothetical protein [Adhaeribacter swui]QNF32543.1 hypothetical protein HUW51_07315 [Adhaeribacter swui]